MQDVAPIIAGAGIIVFLAHLFNTIFNRFRIPDVLFLIAIGIIVGPITGLMPISTLGEVGNIFATITLIIILFESGTSLDIQSLKHAAGGAVSLALASFILTTIVVTVIVFWLTDAGFLSSLIAGAVVGSTSEAIVIPLMRQLKIKEESQALLSVEAPVSAVLSLVIVVALIEVNKSGQFQIFHVTGNILASFFVAICLGIGGAYLWSIFLNKVRLFKNTTFTTAAFVFVIFGIVEMLGFSGAISALVFGITLSNLKSVPIVFFKSYSAPEPGLTELEKNFFSEIAFLLKTFFFVYLGMSLQIISARMIIMAAGLTMIAFFLRLAAPRVCLRKGFPLRDASFIAVMMPRGLTALILASIAFQQGLAAGEVIKDLTYGVVLFSIILTSLLVLLIDKTRIFALFSFLFLPGISKIGLKDQSEGNAGD